MERILEIIGGYRPAGRERLHIETPVPVCYAAVDPDRLRVELSAGAAAHLVVLHTREGISALDVTLAEGAQLEYTELFLEGAFSETSVTQAARSRCRLTTALLSGANASYRLDLTGPDAENDLGGVFLLGGSEHGVVKLLTRHLSADCRSDSTVKGVAGGHAVGEFSGLVYVAQDAQRTDARQQSRNVLLSPEARIDAKPQLEIYADDVKCSHGATVGQMDSAAILYMRQRGLSESQARRLQIEGFAYDVTSHCRHAELCRYIGERTSDKFKRMW